jgi:hypothetical protein
MSETRFEVFIKECEFCRDFDEETNICPAMTACESNAFFLQDYPLLGMSRPKINQNACTKCEKCWHECSAFGRYDGVRKIVDGIFWKKRTMWVNGKKLDMER